MSETPKQTQPDFDDEFLQEIEKWRAQHKIPNDDLILPLLSLFRIHQNHWDELRRRQMPSLDEFRTEVAAVTESVEHFGEKLDELSQLLARHSAAAEKQTVPLSEACYAVAVTLLAGLLFGMAVVDFLQ